MNSDFWGAAPLWMTAIAISAIFFVADHRNPIGRRLATSSHGMLGALAFLYACLAADVTSKVPVASLLVS